MKEGHCYNPATKRICRLDQAKTKKLIKLGVIVLPRDLEMPNEEPEEVIEEKNEVIEEEPEVIEPKPDIIKPVLQKELKSIIKENKNEFKNLTQKESDELLKRMLYQKLVLNVPKKQKEKKKKTTKFKLKKIVVSDSDTDSESESD
jgi:CHAT domain-containing protein